MPSCNTYRLTWVSLTLDEGYLLSATLHDLECGIAPLGPPVPSQPLLLGHGVAPLSHCPWPQMWGRSSQLLLLTSEVGQLFSDIVQETGIKTNPMEKKCKKAKWLSGEALQIAVKTREVKSKGEKER